MDNGGGRPSCGAEGTSHIPTTEPKLTPFEYLTARLGEFVQKMSAAGQIVTDGMLQKEAPLRCIL